MNAKVVLSESGIPAPSPSVPLSAEMACRCNTHAASHHYFCSLQILLPLKLRESRRAAGIRAQTLPSDRQSSLSKRNEQHHFFVQEKQLCVLYPNEQ